MLSSAAPGVVHFLENCLTGGLASCNGNSGVSVHTQVPTRNFVHQIITLNTFQLNPIVPKAHYLTLGTNGLNAAPKKMQLVHSVPVVTCLFNYLYTQFHTHLT